MIRKIASLPAWRLYLHRRRGPDEFRRVLPFRRSWIAIALVAACDVVFLLPAVATFRQAASEWAGFEDLFDLVSAVFLSGWLLGWSLAPLLLTAVLVLLLFGRELVRIRPGSLQLVLGLPLLGVAVEYDPARVRNLRLRRPARNTSDSWRGPHLVFDYGERRVAFGSDLGESDLDETRPAIEAAGALPAAGHAAPRPRTQWPLETADRSAATARRGSAAPASRNGLSSVALVAANLIPLFGAAFLGWRLADILVVYWAESAVIGFYHCLKMVVVGRWLALIGVPFFIGHFGAFMAVHFLFLYGLFIQGPQATDGGDLTAVGHLFTGLWPALAALFVSHGMSFFRNFPGGGEHSDRGLKDEMSAPYRRIAFMHLVLIIGGGITLLLGEPTPVLLIVIVLKIIADLRAHLRQHDQTA